MTTGPELVSNVEFTDLVINPTELPLGRLTVGPWPKGWTRIEIMVPDDGASVYGKMKKVHEWVKKTLKGRYGFYEYVITQTKTEHRIVLSFEERNDAILFKLLGGNKAWELKDKGSN